MNQNIKTFIEGMEYVRQMAHNERCSDGRCFLRDKSVAIGMQTNGGCHCLDGVNPRKRYAANILGSLDISKILEVIKIYDAQLEQLSKYVAYNGDEWVREGANEARAEAEKLFQKGDG